MQQLPLWLGEGKQPYLFIHTPDNAGAPELALRLYQKLRHRLAMDAESPQARLKLPELALLPPEPQQPQSQLGLEW
ncbi:hypothetical protein [Shewanella salipaludis]|uniref:hypothetical protein n=1 Tax=Shewanella salipaludis TaxID=2723052 RepID=UPI003CC7E4FA